jgi:hypothetical protein
MKMKIAYAGALMLLSMISPAQTKPADTVVIKVGEGSKIIVAVQKEDLETMKQYDFQKLMTDNQTGTKGYGKSAISFHRLS